MTTVGRPRNCPGAGLGPRGTAARAGTDPVGEPCCTGHPAERAGLTAGRAGTHPPHHPRHPATVLLGPWGQVASPL